MWQITWPQRQSIPHTRERGMYNSGGHSPGPIHRAHYSSKDL